jgi:hypothetical protein
LNTARIERELGRGGMSIVNPVQEPKGSMHAQQDFKILNAALGLRERGAGNTPLHLTAGAFVAQAGSHESIPVVSPSRP